MSALVAVVVWVGLGLLVPVVIGLYSSDTALQHTVVAAPRDSFTITQPVVLAAFPGVRVARGTIVLVDSSGRPARPGATFDPSHLLIENGLLDVAVPAPAEAEIAEAADSPNTFTEALAPLVSALTATKYETLWLRRTAVAIGVGPGTTETLDDVEASITRRRGAIVVKGSGALRGQRVNFELTAGAPAADATGTPSVPLKFSIKAPLLDAQFDGVMRSEQGIALEGQGETSLRGVRRVARWFGAYWNSGPGLRDLLAKGHVGFGKQTLSFDNATFKIDGNDAAGAVAMAFAGVRPQITGTLAFKSIDIGNFLFSSATESLEPLSWSMFARGALTVPLDMNLDADVRVSAEVGKLAAFEFEQLAATIALKDGRLLADIVDFEFAGGHGGGQLGADFTGYQPKLSLRGGLQRTDLGLVSKAMAGRELAQGAGTIVVDMTASGATATDILTSLSGKLAIGSKTGGRLGVDLAQLAGVAQVKELTGWGLARRGRTDFEELDLRLVVRDGVLLTETAEAKTSSGAWTATGLVNLPRQNIDIQLTETRPLQGAKGGGADAKPAVLDLRGPWNGPSIRSQSEPSSASGSDPWPPANPALIASPDRG